MAWTPRKVKKIRYDGRMLPAGRAATEREVAARPIDRTIDLRIIIGECIKQKRGAPLLNKIEELYMVDAYCNLWYTLENLQICARERVCVLVLVCVGVRQCESACV